MEKQVNKHFIKNALKKTSLAKVAYSYVRKITSFFGFIRDFHEFKSKSKSNRFPLRWKDRWPCLDDKTSHTDFDRHYVYHTAWAMRILRHTNPKRHIDISSSLYFAAMASAFFPIKFFDFRPAGLLLNGLECAAADLLALPFPDESVKSISCMHVVEHIGLGRYGDPFDPEGDLKAIEELKRVVAKRGQLLFVTPIGKPRVMFNAHRVYSYEQIIRYFVDVRLKEFTLIPDNPYHGGLVRNATREMADAQRYGCGCFWFRK